MSGRGARLLVKGSIAFGGAVTFSGRLSVQGRAELPSASVHVWDDCTVATGAELRIENCTNVDPWLGGGGGVYVNGALHVDGALEVHQSHSAYGGGVYVEGTSAQRMEPWGCARGDLHLRGKMNITGCTAGKDGGLGLGGGERTLATNVQQQSCVTAAQELFLFQGAAW